MAENSNDYIAVDPYTLDGEFFGCLPVDALYSVGWRDVISLDDVVLSFRGSFETKRVRHVSDLFRCLNSLPNVPVIEYYDFDLWCYRTYGEPVYVNNLCSLPVERLHSWLKRYMVHLDAISWGKAIRMSQFRYGYRCSSKYRHAQIHLERCTLSAPGQCVRHHLLCAYNLTETARDQVLLFIPNTFCR